ncbi:MAG: alpha-N-acetylglucosaminidase N-terminal domain-containing protein, partial [Bacteroidaceae bacterium]|nr:alpha-N-acetylglucosaminidase N-terminal domain-containing protein [Bacteroidaceae bacterium]
MKTRLTLIILSMISIHAFALNPVEQLLERIDKGASAKFKIEISNGSKDFFELSQKKDKIVIKGNNAVNAAVGLNWYLKYYAGINLTWNQMSAILPDKMPEVKAPERHETNLSLRYDFNYCTFSYSMAFWNWERWEKEIDWMAL